MFIRTSITLILFASLALGGCTSKSSGGGNSGPNGGNGGEGGTAPASRFFLPTGEPDNTSAPTVEVDAQGGIHAIYPAYAIGGAYYAYCPSSCAGASDVSVVRFETDGTVGNAMLALDSSGRPRVLLSSYQHVYYASCDANCTTQDGWKIAPIIDHNAEKQITGKALSLDPEGHPRFLMHTYIAFLGVGQKPPATEWVTCDADCQSPSSWKASVIANQIYQSSTLRFDTKGGAHVATVATVDGKDLDAYQYCASDCDKEASWSGPSFAEAYASEYEAVAMKPATTLALTAAGNPRLLVLAKGDDGKKNLIYLACDERCSDPNGPWTAARITDDDELAQGIDLALDASDRPRVAFSLDYNIGIAYCNAADCTAEDVNWDVTRVEAGSEMLADKIFPYGDCDVGAWFLHGPSIAITKDGLARVGYQSRDISGGTGRRCSAGTDMTFARLAVLTGL